MGEFFSAQFTWENVLTQLMWAYLMTACLRLLTWLFRVSLQDRHRELAFWLVVPVSVLVLALFLSRATVISPKGQPS
jgi:membrane protein DedA with SNARE-associated domain